jgi:GDP-mannose 4,6-dehydratase
VTATDCKTALITGVTGQDGAYLARLLLENGYVVHGVKRRSSSFNTGRIEDIYEDPHIEHQRFHLHYGDLTDATNLIRIVKEVPCPGQLRDPRIYRKLRCARHLEAPGSDPHPWT